MDFPALFSSAEMGHQLQLVGVTLLGVAMTASERAGEARGASGASPASHGLLPAHHSRGSSSSGPGGQRGVTARAGGTHGALGGLAARPCSWRGSHGNVQASLQERRQQPRLLPACQLGNPGQLQPLRLLKSIFQQRLGFFFFLENKSL